MEILTLMNIAQSLDLCLKKLEMFKLQIPVIFIIRF